MKKILFLLLIFSLSCFARVYHKKASVTFLKKHDYKVIDIRTKKEWRQTGVIKNSILLTLIDEKGRYNINEFLNKLSNQISKDEKFAIICATGNRSTRLANFLDKKGYEVINLRGGIKALQKQNYHFEKY